MSYTLDVQEATDGAVYIILPDDFIDEVGWAKETSSNGMSRVMEFNSTD